MSETPAEVPVLDGVVSDKDRLEFALLSEKAKRSALQVKLAEHVLIDARNAQTAIQEQYLSLNKAMMDKYGLKDGDSIDETSGTINRKK